MVNGEWWMVNSTSVAAIQVKQGLADLAITNENALREYDCSLD